MTDGARLDIGITAAKEAGEEPLALLDVDLTLLDNAARNRAIWADFAHSLRGRWSGAEAAVAAAATMPIVFGVLDNLATLEIPGALRQDGLRHWIKAFFSDRYLGLDTALPGALEAVLRLREAEVTVVYLTARPSRMVAGTVSRFVELGFPVAVPGTVLAMKPRPRDDDGEYKAGALDWIGRLGTPVLCADNEPGHVNAMHRRFPQAVSVLADTRHSAGAPPLEPGIARIASLLEVLPARPGDVGGHGEGEGEGDENAETHGDGRGSDGVES